MNVNLTEAQSSKNTRFDSLEIFLGQSRGKVSALAFMIAAGSEQVETIKTYGRKHIALRPANWSVEGGWKRLFKSQRDDVSDVMSWRGIGNRHHCA